MSKEYMQALDDLFGLVAFQEGFGRAQKYFDIIEEALQRLESIDNANPSEVLKYLEEWYGFLMADNDTTYSNGYENEIEYNRRKEAIYKQYYIIKQALLKAQEQENKKYLKWEDLEKLGKEIKVKLNGVEYLLCKKVVIGFSEYYLYPKGNQRPVLMCLGDNDYEKQFFNDLHLERVEE